MGCEGHSGGFAERARVKGDWLVKMPKGIDAAHAMAIGTAGYTSMLCVMALEDAGLTPDAGEILVTGANGGVGSVAIALLSKLGYSVTASTGRTSEEAFLKGLARPALWIVKSSTHHPSHLPSPAGQVVLMRSGPRHWQMCCRK